MSIFDGKYSGHRDMRLRLMYIIEGTMMVSVAEHIDHDIWDYLDDRVRGAAGLTIRHIRETA